MVGSLTNVLNIAASGLDAAGAQASTAAGNIANADTPGYQAKRVDLVELSGGGVGVSGVSSDPTSGAAGGSNVDLAHEAVDLIRAKTLYAANAAVIRTANQMYGSLLDIFDDGRHHRHDDATRPF